LARNILGSNMAFLLFFTESPFPGRGRDHVRQLYSDFKAQNK
jgi:hypothetical protein